MTTRPNLQELFEGFLWNEMELILAAEPDELEAVLDEAFLRRFSALAWLDVAQRDILRRQIIVEVRRERITDLRRERRLNGVIGLLEAFGIPVVDHDDPEVLALDARRGVIL
ncbi:MAG: hypothetical protein WD883_01160 [Candidatus Colwellbacteria bacterium]